MEEHHSTLLLSLSITACYFIYKYLELRFILKEEKPLKLLFRETIIVFLSCFLGIFILNQVKPLTVVMSSSMPKVFVNDPEF